MLLNHFRVPVVPTYIDGAYEALPPGTYWPKSTQVTIRFGEPVHVDDLFNLGEGENQEGRIVKGLRKKLLEMSEPWD